MTTIGGFLMARKYSNNSRHENEIIEMWNSEKRLRESGNLLEFTYDEVQDFKIS